MTTYFNEELKTTKPINWGQVYYDSITDPNRSTQAFAAKPRVQFMLERVVETEEGPVDATQLLNLLTDDELCDFFARIPNCRSIILRDWTSISEKVVRALSFCVGSSLRQIDFSHSSISEKELDVLMTNTSDIEVLRMENCKNVDSRVMALLARSCHRTIRELYVQSCPQFKEDPLLSMCGCIGVNAARMNKLLLIDLSDCPLLDKGLIAVAECCKLLRFLNLTNCSNITDPAVMAIAQNCHHLEVLNLFACFNVGSKPVIALAKNCHHLHSLNLTKLNKVNDTAIIALGKHCKHLQALNIAGLLKITENSLLSLAQGCPGLLMLNVTGCQFITVAGLKALSSGLQYVELAVSYVGLKPVSEHIEKKLNDQIEFIYERAATTITRSMGNVNKRLRIKAEYHEERINKAASQIQGSFYRYKCRLHFYWIYIEKKQLAACKLIQRWARGCAGRAVATVIRGREAYFFINTPSAIQIQRVFRGHCTRKRANRVCRVLREMYIVRREESEWAVAVRLQCMARFWLASRRTAALKELVTRRLKDEYNAATTMQGAGKVFLAKLQMAKKKGAVARSGEIREIAASRIQAFYRATQGRYRMKQSKFEREMVMRARISGARLVQRVVRGYMARNVTYRMRIKLAEKYFAARTIQRYYRGTRIMQWRDMRLNIIAAYVLDRQYLERRERVEASRVRYQQFKEDNQKDSASEEEPPEEILEWEKIYDEDRRKYYWYNEYLDRVQWHEPEEPIAMAKGMVGIRIRVYWVAQRAWYEGEIGRYHRRKRRHRVNYDDGDHEWLELEVERDRIQIQQADGSWVDYINYRPPEMLEEWRKIEKKRETEDYRKQAFKDASQWRVLKSDHTDQIMFVSDLTGEIRTGVDEADNWVVQDDGHGFPCFYNVVSGATEHDDPRFVDDESEDARKVKDYVMQELRIAVYFCKDFWDRYCEAADNLMFTNAEEVPKKAMAICLQTRNSSKPKHLVAFLIRAKALYKQTSVVDEPINHKIFRELDYATWLATQISQLVQLGDAKVVMQRDAQVVHTEKLLAKSKGIVYCSNCHRETKRHYDFCKVCRKRQLFVLDKLPDDENDDGSKLTKSQIHALKFGGDNGMHVENGEDMALLTRAEGENEENTGADGEEDREGETNPNTSGHVSGAASSQHSARDSNQDQENDDTSQLSDDEEDINREDKDDEED